MSVNRGMDKEDVVYPYNGILFSHKKELNTDTRYNVDEPRKYYSEQNTSGTKNKFYIIPLI